VYVAPQYLPDEYGNPRELRTFRKHINFRHAFTLYFPKFLPKSVMTRFLSKHGSKAKYHLYWKYGIGFYLEEKRVYAAYNFEEREIKIEVQNGSKRVAGLVFQTLYQIIQNDEFEVILEGQPPMLWRDLLRDSGRLNPALVQAYQHLMNPPGIKPKPIMKKIFVSYSHADIVYRDELVKRLKFLLRQEKIEQIWYDHEILPGADWDAEIESNLKSADMIFLLISDDFWASDYINEKELKIAKERHEAKECVVVPILVRVNSYWKGSGWDTLQAVPTDPNTGKLTPIKKWQDSDEAWVTVIEGIKKLL